MIREVLVLSSWFILAGALPLTLPDITDDAEVFSDSKLQAQLKQTADPASTTGLEYPKALKLNTGLYFTGAEVPAAALDLADVLKLNTSLQLSGIAVSTDDVDSTPTVELIIDLLPAGVVDRTTDVNLNTTQALKFFTDLKSHIARFMERTTDRPKASGIGDYLEEPPTGKLEEPSTSREGDKFIPKLNCKCLLSCTIDTIFNAGFGPLENEADSPSTVISALLTTAF